MKAYYPFILPLALIASTLGSCKQTTGSEPEITPADTTTYTGDDDNDLVENQTWSSTINIVWNGTNVTVTGEAEGVSVTADNGYVTVNSTVKHIEYAVSGNGTGQLSIYSDYKFKLSLNGLTLTCSDGPAINNQGKKHCYVVLGGTNTLIDGSTYASSTEDRKAAFFSEGQLCFSGDGSLFVTGNYKHALACDDYIRLCPGTGTINLTAKVSDGMHVNDGVVINDGALTINAVQEGIQCDTSSIYITGGDINITSSNDKGIVAYSNVEIYGGTIRISSEYKCIKAGKKENNTIVSAGNITIGGGDITAICNGAATSSGGPGGGWGGSSSDTSTPEAIEAKGTITINGGKVYAQSADDAINSAGVMTINGGYVCAYSTSNDGLDANADLYINGGVVYAIGAGGAEKSIDALEHCTLYVNGGTLFCIGDLEGGASLKQSCYSASSWSASTWYAMTIGDETIVFKTPSNTSSGSGHGPGEGGSNRTLVVSGASKPTLKSGVTVSNGTTIFNGMGMLNASVSGGSTVSLSSYTPSSNGW